MDQYELQIANALWVARSNPIREDFIKKIANFYGTGAAIPADFTGDPDGECERINTWIEENTNGRIKGALASSSIDELTRLIITNAIYFHGQWVDPFPKHSTEACDFFTAPGESSKVTTMRNTTQAGRYGAFEPDGTLFSTPGYYDPDAPPKFYAGENGFALYEMPYKGNDLAMVILSPNSIDGLSAIEKDLTYAKLDAWIAKLQQRETDVSLPKFKTNTRYSLNKTLSDMGMESAFGEDADFSGMTKNGEQLYPSEVLQQAYISVDEEGTEAAAASIIENQKCSNVYFIPEFRADRPFLFIIRDKRSGSILFMGRIAHSRSSRRFVYPSSTRERTGHPSL